MCAPYFRDVLIWKNSNEKVIKTFLLCFSCDQYKFSEGETETVIVDFSEENIYAESIEKLKDFFRIFDKKADFIRTGDEILTLEEKKSNVQPEKIVHRNKNFIEPLIKRPWLKK